MGLKDEFAREEDFSVKQGARTLTVELDCKQLAVPWVGFLYSVRSPKKIRIFFSSWIVTISGREMDELWEGVQQQHLCHVRESSGSTEGGRDFCVITALEVESVIKKK